MIAKTLILLTRGWQLGPSKVLPPSCRYQPSCSAYAITALQRYGAAKGGWLALKRIFRCHPWGGQGPDRYPDFQGDFVNDNRNMLLAIVLSAFGSSLELAF